MRFTRLVLLCLCFCTILTLAACGGSSSDDSGGGDSGGGDPVDTGPVFTGDWRSANIGTDTDSLWIGAFESLISSSTMAVSVIGESDGAPPVGSDLELTYAISAAGEIEPVDNVTLSIDQTGWANEALNTFVTGTDNVDTDGEGTLMVGIKQGPLSIADNPLATVQDYGVFTVFVVHSGDNATNDVTMGRLKLVFGSDNATLSPQNPNEIHTGLDSDFTDQWAGLDPSPYDVDNLTSYSIDYTTGALGIDYDNRTFNGQMREDGQLFFVADTGDDSSNDFKSFMIGIGPDNSDYFTTDNFTGTFYALSVCVDDGGGGYDVDRYAITLDNATDNITFDSLTALDSGTVPVEFGASAGGNIIKAADNVTGMLTVASDFLVLMYEAPSSDWGDWCLTAGPKVPAGTSF